MKKYLRHLAFTGDDAYDVENWVDSKEFDNCELVSINTYVNADMEVIHELWYWVVVE